MPQPVIESAKGRKWWFGMKMLSTSGLVYPATLFYVLEHKEKSELEDHN